MKFKLLDCFCGLGGVSEGFVAEGFECVGIEINLEIAKLYPFKCIVSDIRDLDGLDFQGYDVIWGSPPCRDFTVICDKRWKEKKNPQRGLELVYCFLRFVRRAQPKIWIMENVPGLEKYLAIKPRISKAYITKTMRRSFWGNFPLFLVPCDTSKPKISSYSGFDKLAKWKRAKIPFVVSRAFARACKQELMKIYG